MGVLDVERGEGGIGLVVQGSVEGGDVRAAGREFRVAPEIVRRAVEVDARCVTVRQQFPGEVAVVLLGVGVVCGVEADGGVAVYQRFGAVAEACLL